jgi:peptide subunit release factor RF-3
MTEVCARGGELRESQVFPPEHFRYINNADPMKAKQLDKGIDQLMDEGLRIILH